MCGRYSLATPADELIEAFDVPDLTFDYVARYNVAPGQDAPIVAEDGRGRRMGMLRWGLVPAWKDERRGAYVNARSETARRTRSFAEAFARRRCLVPADGFYEWRREGRIRTPYWFHSGEGVLSLAGIWERWSRPGTEPLHTFAILTADANADVRSVHDRMPVIIAREHRDAWLDRGAQLDRVEALMGPAPDGLLERRAVSRRVNRVDEDDVGLIEPLADG